MEGRTATRRLISTRERDRKPNWRARCPGGRDRKPNWRARCPGERDRTGNRRLGRARQRDGRPKKNLLRRAGSALASGICRSASPLAIPHAFVDWRRHAGSVINASPRPFGRSGQSRSRAVLRARARAPETAARTGRSTAPLTPLLRTPRSAPPPSTEASETRETLPMVRQATPATPARSTSTFATAAASRRWWTRRTAAGAGSRAAGRKCVPAGRARRRAFPASRLAPEAASICAHGQRQLRRVRQRLRRGAVCRWDVRRRGRSGRRRRRVYRRWRARERLGRRRLGVRRPRRDDDVHLGPLLVHGHHFQRERLDRRLRQHEGALRTGWGRRRRRPQRQVRRQRSEDRYRGNALGGVRCGDEPGGRDGGPPRASRRRPPLRSRAHGSRRRARDRQRVRRPREPGRSGAAVSRDRRRALRIPGRNRDGQGHLRGSAPAGAEPGESAVRLHAPDSSRGHRAGRASAQRQRLDRPRPWAALQLQHPCAGRSPLRDVLLRRDETDGAAHDRGSTDTPPSSSAATSLHHVTRSRSRSIQREHSTSSSPVRSATRTTSPSATRATRRSSASTSARRSAFLLRATSRWPPTSMLPRRTSSRGRARMTFYGSVIAGSFISSEPTKIHYDQGVLASGGSCADAGQPTCGSCTDCANQACIGGQCGACTDSSQCCAPLECFSGVCRVSPPAK